MTSTIIPQPRPRAAYSIAEVCRLCGLGRSSVYKAIARAELRAVKAGTRTLVLADDLDAWLASFQSACAAR